MKRGVQLTWMTVVIDVLQQGLDGDILDRRRVHAGPAALAGSLWPRHHLIIPQLHHQLLASAPLMQALAGLHNVTDVN